MAGYYSLHWHGLLPTKLIMVENAEQRMYPFIIWYAET